MATKKKNRAIIVENTSQGNSFGDRTFNVTVVVRNQYQEQVTEKTFTETAFEGEHGYYRSKIQKDIKAFAKENGAVYTGRV